MKKPVIIVGVGEIGGVFARGFLRLGHPVYPVTRTMNLADACASMPEPELVLIAVAEQELHSVLDQIPSRWRDLLGLLQNELLPRDWRSHSLIAPTVTSIWFEKKPGQDAKVLLPSPAFGPRAELLVAALKAVNIAATTLGSEAELNYELVRKNIYILTTNIAGLECGGTVEELWRQHRTLAEQVAAEVMDIQAWLCQESLDREKLLQGLEQGIKADPAHRCMGRSAPSRLQRALAFADQAGLEAPKLRAIQASL